MGPKWTCATLASWEVETPTPLILGRPTWPLLPSGLPSGMQRSRAWCGTPPILGVVNMVGTRNFTCYMGAL